ncbi:MAG: class C sortase [Eubacteriaceae bacterium]
MRKIFLILGMMVLLVGIGVLLYPLWLETFYNRDIKDLEKKYEEKIEGDSRLDALYEKLKAYNLTLFETGQNGLKDPFSYSQPNFDLSEYGLLDNMIGFINIPKMEISLPIYLGANNENMEKGAVHLTETSFPIGGINTNAVIAAHRGYITPMFRNIHFLEIGDEIIIKNFREELLYRVTEIKIIHPSAIEEVLIQPGKDMVTLSTCNPLGENYERYIVYAERVN